MRTVPTGAAALALALSVLLAPAAAAESARCGEGAATIDVAALLEARSGAVSHAWGAENLAPLPAEAGAGGPAVRVGYPAGSFSPGRSRVRGGAGFQFAGGPATAACLSYKVRFAPDFDFAKGGKLPGLFGGEAPRGCVGEGAASGFSARLMWRAGGAGELYLYAPGRGQRCGASIGRGSFRFAPGRWTQVTERVSIGSPGRQDGRIEVWIDDRLAVSADGLGLADAGAASVDGLLFATFFGGDDPTWATPRDQYADFADFRIAASAR